MLMKGRNYVLWPIIKRELQMPHGASSNPTGNPIGGGRGYSEIFTAEPGVVVRTLQELLYALSHASGGLIYIDDDCEIDLTDAPDIPTTRQPDGNSSGTPWVFLLEIPDNTILASGRGRNQSEGALLRAGKRAKRFSAIGIRGNARITGLRLLGPGGASNGMNEFGIDFMPGTPLAKLEVDNCLVKNWCGVGISVGRVVNAPVPPEPHAFVHHNEIVNNYTPPDPGLHALGYGVQVSACHALIEANTFNYQRHHIAGTHLPTTFYEARYNIFGVTSLLKPAVDMHGDSHVTTRPSRAGFGFNVHHNTFTSASLSSLGIRGKPIAQSMATWNDFPHKTEYHFNPIYGDRRNPKVGILQVVTQGNISHADNLAPAAKVAWCIASGASDPWRRIAFSAKTFSESTTNRRLSYFLRTGRFFSDSRADIFRADGHSWFVSKSGRYPWQKIADSRFLLKHMVLTDVNGDGFTDFLRVRNNSDGTSSFLASVSSMGEGNSLGWADWSELLRFPGTHALADFVFADLTGDGATDIMRLSPLSGRTSVEVSFGGSTPFSTVVTWDVPVRKADILLGRFLGGKAMNVIVADAARREWSIWSLGQNGLTPYRSLRSAIPIGELGVGDFNGDGHDDVLWADGNMWYVSPAGRWAFRPKQQSDFHRVWLAFGDFDGDGRTDVFAASQVLNDKPPLDPMPI
jgi:hypothetical protein